MRSALSPLVLPPLLMDCWESRISTQHLLFLGFLQWIDYSPWQFTAPLPRVPAPLAVTSNTGREIFAESGFTAALACRDPTFSPSIFCSHWWDARRLWFHIPSGFAVYHRHTNKNKRYRWCVYRTVNSDRSDESLNQELNSDWDITVRNSFYRNHHLGYADARRRHVETFCNPRNDSNWTCQNKTTGRREK